MIKLVIFIVGAVVGGVLVALMTRPDPWGSVNRYRDYVNGGYREDVKPYGGFMAVDGGDVPKVREALGRLVDFGEVACSTFVIPGANNPENIKRWMGSDLFLDAQGAVQLTDVEIDKSSDLVFTAWYKTSDRQLVLEFIEEVVVNADRTNTQQLDSEVSLFRDGPDL